MSKPHAYVCTNWSAAEKVRLKNALDIVLATTLGAGRNAYTEIDTSTYYGVVVRGLNTVTTATRKQLVAQLDATYDSFNAKRPSTVTHNADNVEVVDLTDIERALDVYFQDDDENDNDIPF